MAAILGNHDQKEKQCIFRLSINSVVNDSRTQNLVAVAREGTFAAAGDKIGLTQPPLAHRCSGWKPNSALPLFDRSARARD